jgi:hypothetical protein
MSASDTAAADIAAAEAIPDTTPTAHHEALLRTARRVFLGCLLYTAGLTVVWAILLVVRPERIPFFKTYNVTWQMVAGIFFYFVFFILMWGFIWYGIRLLFLRRYVKMSKEDALEVFNSRMRRPFDLAKYLARYNERRIRIADMIGRRGRFVTIATLLFSATYVGMAKDQDPSHFTPGMADSLFGAIAMNYLALAFFYSDGVLARAFFGPQSRVMDGVLGRANCLIISTLWSAFAFVMVPISGLLAAHFPANTLAAAFLFIWPSYLAADALAEIVGSLFGKQKLRVWGIGEVNKNSVEGELDAFVGSLAVCLAAVALHHLPPAWIGLALVISLSNTLLELFSPRGTDDFTMATANALICAAFGVMYY